MKRSRGWWGRALALVAAGALVLAVFLPWDRTGRIAADVGPAPSPLAWLLLVIAALPAVAAAVAAEAVWPRALAAVASAVLVLTWLLTGPDGALTSGVWLAVGGTVGLILASAAPHPR